MYSITLESIELFHCCRTRFKFEHGDNKHFFFVRNFFYYESFISQMRYIGTHERVTTDKANRPITADCSSKRRIYKEQIQLEKK